MRRLTVVSAVIMAALLAAAPVGVGAGSDTRVSVGSPPTPMSADKQNEPAVAVDAHAPNVVVAGAHDNIGVEACNAGPDNSCPFTPGVGVSGVYFSFDSGHSWTQPTYSGNTARHCVTPAPCTPTTGPIGTLPRFDEAGLVSDGDPAVAFGPVRRNGAFSWANGSRLYYASLASSLA